MLNMLMMLPLEHAHSPTEEIGAGMMILGIVYYLVRHFLGKRGYEKKLRGLEAKMEQDPDNTLTGSSNPGRSTVDLVEVIYEDVKEVKRTLTRHEGELGKIKGKIGID